MSTDDNNLSTPDGANQDDQPGPLQRAQITERLSVLGRNPFTQAHIYTTASLASLSLTDLEAIREFPHIQHLVCRQNQLQSLSPLQHLPLLLTLDATDNHLTEVLDFEVPKCYPGNAWVDGARWIGSLLRKATLDKNRITCMPRHELANTHPFLLELQLAHNSIEEISGVSQLRFLRLLDLSYNRLTSMTGLVGKEHSSCGLQALETLLLSHNQLADIDPGVALLPRLTRLDVAHNKLATLSSLGDCVRLQQLHLAHNDVVDINELNVLASLRYLGQLSLHGNPLVEAQVSCVFYRARVLRRLLQLEKLDNEQVTFKEKVKALAMHGSDREARRQVAAKYLPGQEFTDFLPPLDFEDDEQLVLPQKPGRYASQMPAPRRALPPPSPDEMNLTDSDENCLSPQYQAVSTPTRASAQDQELLVEEVMRSRSHSHALSAILGANGRVSASNSIDWRPSSQAQLQVGNSTAQMRETVAESEEKTELPVRLTKWRRRKRRWRKILFWVIAVGVFIAVFALSFAAPKHIETLAPIVLGAGLSLVSTLLALVSFLRRRRLRRRPNELLAFVALSEFGLALLTLIHVLTMCSTEDGSCRPMGIATCSAAVGLEMFMLLAGIGWFGAAILHLFVSVSNPFASYKRQVLLYHIVVWGLSLIASIVTPLALFSGHVQGRFQLTSAEICRSVALILPMLPSDAAESAAKRTFRLTQWQELNLEFWGLLVAVVVVVVVAAQLSLVVGWWRSNSGTIIALKARRRLMKRMAIYVHALNAMWLVLLVVFFVYRSNASALDYVQVEGLSHPDDKGMNFLNALFHFVLTGKGFVTGVVWLSVNKPCCAFGLVSCGLHQCKDDSEGPSLGQSAIASSQSASLSGSSNADIGVQRNQAAILSATVMSMEAGVLVPQDTPMLSPSSTVVFEAHESVRESGVQRQQERHSLPSLSSVIGPPSTARSSRSSSSSYDASTLESYEASQNNETLQREIIYYTVCGITKAIIRSAERARSSSVPTEEACAVLGEENVNSTARERDGLVETTLFVGAERDSTLVNNSFISHVQNVTILTFPRAYCEPIAPLPVAGLRRSVAGFEGENGRGSSTAHHPRPTSFTAASTLEHVGNWRQPLHLQHSRSHGSPSPQSARLSLTASHVMFRSFHQTPGRFSLYPVSQVPFELFEQEIELQSTRDSTDEAATEGRSTRSAVLAGLRRTATSAFSQGRGVFRGRSASTEVTMDAEPSSTAVTREFLPDDPKPKVFIDYAPREFRAIRLAFGLSDEKYLASFRTTAKERVSAGSSGAFMFFSGDNSLLVKSLKEKECRALVDMAPAYARYLTANPHSRLIRFFGCHRVRLYGRNFYFAVMTNVLHSERHTATIVEKYDVKGSWVDRRARRPQRGDRVTCAECDATYTFGGNEDGDTPNATVDTDDGRISTVDERTVPQFPFHVHRPDIVFKDLDLERSLELPRDIATHLHAQIVSDCEFLRDIGIMDYSLLIGIHKCHLRAPHSSSANGVGSADFDEIFNRELNLDELNSGVNLAPLGDNEVYFVGIIDILQQWDWEKQFEKAGKVLLGKSSRGISAVAPAAYCRRFQARCTQILLGGSAPEDLDQDWDVDPDAANAKESKPRHSSKNVKEMTMANLISEKA